VGGVGGVVVGVEFRDIFVADDEQVFGVCFFGLVREVERAGDD
jgi:hypothetical protein